jgi:glutaredoxin
MNHVWTAAPGYPADRNSAAKREVAIRIRIWLQPLPFSTPHDPTGTNPPTLAKLTPMSEPRQVVLYSRKGCHLCEIVKETLTKLHRRGGFTWQDVDVDSDDQLRRQFTDEVPVVFIDGRKAFKYRMDESDFLRKLAS